MNVHLVSACFLPAALLLALTACDMEHGRIIPADRSASGAGGGVPDALDGCNPLSGTDACALPLPSRFATRADAASPTGYRLALDPEKLPLRDGSIPLDAAPYDAADGFSPVTPILVHFGVDVDLAALPGPRDLEASLEPDAPIALFDMETGKRVMFFAETDQNRKVGYDGRYAFILRPLEPMAMGHRHVVAIRRGLRDTSGAEIAPPAGFAALRDGAATTSQALEDARPGFEEVFAFLEQQGRPRGDLLLAWDFPVASEEHLLGSVLSMRATALEMVGDQGLPYVVTKVVEHPNDLIAKIVEGDFEVPTFLRDDKTFEYDAAHHPVLQAKNRSYPFTMLVPKKAEAGEPLPLVVLGHGIFGSGRSFLTEGADALAIQGLAEQFGAIVIATDWIGLSSKDLAEIGIELSGSLDRLGIVTDQLQQALVNTLAMTRLARGALASDPQATVAGSALVDTAQPTLYWGASLGGIQGSSFVSISDDIERAVFGVPGSTWSTMLSRSIVFPPVKQVLEPHYPDPLDMQILITFAQARFDHADPANLSKLMFERPLPDAPKNRVVILQEAIGDSQVPNMTSELLARAMGVKLLVPSVEPVFGLEPAESPTKASVLAQYRLEGWDQPAPPETNLAPAEDNGVHHSMNFLPNVHTQIARLFLDGEVEQYCDGACDPD